MKMIASIILFCCAATNFTQAQSTGMFGQKIDVSMYRGKKFTLQAHVKASLIDTDRKNGGSLWVRILKGKTLVSELYSNNAIRLNEWKQYSISDKIDDSATTMIVGGLFDGRGVYAYDNFKLTIAQSKNKFIDVPIVDNNFETDSIELKKAWPVRVLSKGFLMQKTDSIVFAGKHALVLDGSKVEKENELGDNDKAGKYATVNGIKIYYEMYGEGEPLLLIHGNQQSIAAFRAQVNVFAKKYKVIVVDSRGQGKSSEDGKRYTYDLFAGDMNGLLNELKIDSANIIGWSDGGNTGLIMAMKYPRKVKKLVTMGANIFINDKDVIEPAMLKSVRDGIKLWQKDTAYDNKNSVRLLRMLLEEPKHSFEELKKIKCPVMVVAGEKDDILESHTKGIAANIKASKLYIAAKETHYFPQQNAKAFNELVLNFLQDNK
jgi:pimeloyl-ACP methyl ester carboxylesterase